MTTATTASKKAPVLVEVTTQPLRKDHAVRTVSIVRGARVNRHYNGDNSITLYANGVKIFRSAGDEQIEAGEVSEDYDAEAAVAKFCTKWFGKGREPVFGKSTYGHNWKSRKAAAPAEEQPQA